MESELRDLLRASLPREIAAMRESMSAQNYVVLLRQVHKLHGATCYCNVPELRKVLADLESALRKNEREIIADLFPVLEQEVAKV